MEDTSARPRTTVTADLAELSSAHWPDGAYLRPDLPERVLQFGTGMLLRAMPAAYVDAANRAGVFGGRIVVVQSTGSGLAGIINRQDRLFTLVERGMEGDEPIERLRLIGSVSRALVADAEWPAICEVAASAELRVVISNVTEAGFRLEGGEPWPTTDAAAAPSSFPAKLAALLHARFRRLGESAPPLLVIPTELVDDNGIRLAEMVDALAGGSPDAADFRAWIAARVRFCSSLVDRITTGMPEPEVRHEIEERLGYRDALLTLAEPYSLWAIEGDPAELADAFPIAVANPEVIFDQSIAFYRERKIRLLNGAHTALAPLALLAGVPTVREATRHPLLAPFQRRILFDEIAPSTDLPADEAVRFAQTLMDRFRNPSLDHPWQTIATNQTAKMRLRVVPSILGYTAKQDHLPPGLVLAVAAYLRFLRPVSVDGPGKGIGWWRGGSYTLEDADLEMMRGHWQAAEGELTTEPVKAIALERLAGSALADASLWGVDMSQVEGLVAATIAGLVALERNGAEAALRQVLASQPGAVPSGYPA